MTSQLQRHFSNNITTLYRCLLIDVFFATLLQRRDVVERRRDLKNNYITTSHVYWDTTSVVEKHLLIKHSSLMKYYLNFKLLRIRMESKSIFDFLS